MKSLGLLVALWLPSSFATAQSVVHELGCPSCLTGNLSDVAGVGDVNGDGIPDAAVAFAVQASNARTSSPVPTARFRTSSPGVCLASGSASQSMDSAM
ncbi:MAG: hypothetical protein E2O39_17585 [Planctomycetota bacterium]|nr:MAG: hypothetical protein E2O39_17585 [Planctomycetota bacterium]